MSRSKGSAQLAASLEVLAGAPLDAREVVQTKADLISADSFPYKYIGLEVYVVAEDKKYRLIGNDPTDEINWKEVGTDDIVINGYMKDKAITSALEFINALNKVSAHPIKVPDPSIFDGKAASAMVMICAPEQAHFVFADNPFNYQIFNTLASGEHDIFSKRQSAVSTTYNGYTSSPINYDEGILADSLGLILFDSRMLSDLSPGSFQDVLLDNERQAWVYVSGNVTIPTTGEGSDYADRTTVLTTTMVFYADAQCTTEIEPQKGRFYTDKPSGTTYYWDGTKYVVCDTKIQFVELPTASADFVGKIVQFVGVTGTYTNGYYYECVENSGSYSWQPKNVQPSGSGGATSYDELTGKPTLNNETINGDKTSSDYGLQDQMQFDEMPTASALYAGKTVQYTGESDGTYTKNYFYECVEESGTYSWTNSNVQPSSGGGGDAELEVSVTSNLAVGAIPSGTTLPQGTTFTEFAQKLLITELAPTTTFSASGSGVKEVGTSVTPTLTLSITDKGTGTPTSIKFYDGSTLLDTQSYVDGTNSYTFTMEAVTTTKTVKGVLEYKKSDNTTATVEKSATYTFVMASYYGAVTTAPADKAGIIALTKNVKNTKALTTTFNLSNQRACYCYPASFGNLTSILDANGFNYIDGYTKTTVDVDGTTYNVYAQTDPVTANGFKQIYA